MIAPCPSTSSSSPPRAGGLDDEPLGCARDEVGHDRVDGEAPAGDRDAGLPGRHENGREPARTGLALELQGDGHLADGAVRADRQHGAAGKLEVGAGRNVEALRRAPEIGEARPMAPGQLDELGVVGDELVQAVLDRDALAQARLQDLAPCGRERAALRGDPDERHGRLEAKRLAHGGDDRKAVHRLARVLRVEDRDDVLAPVAQHATHRLAVVRVGRIALCEDEHAT